MVYSFQVHYLFTKIRCIVDNNASGEPVLVHRYGITGSIGMNK